MNLNNRSHFRTFLLIGASKFFSVAISIFYTFYIINTYPDHDSSFYWQLLSFSYITSIIFRFGSEIKSYQISVTQKQSYVSPEIIFLLLTSVCDFNNYIGIRQRKREISPFSLFVLYGIPNFYAVFFIYKDKSISCPQYFSDRQSNILVNNTYTPPSTGKFLNSTSEKMDENYFFVVSFYYFNCKSSIHSLVWHYFYRLYVYAEQC